MLTLWDDGLVGYAGNVPYRIQAAVPGSGAVYTLTPLRGQHSPDEADTADHAIREQRKPASVVVQWLVKDESGALVSADAPRKRGRPAKAKPE